MHRHRLNVPVCVGVGASFDFLSGRFRRAPVWMQRSGMEWLYRTVQEPSRLTKRYASNALGLLRYLPLQLAAMALQSKRRPLAQITNETIGTAVILSIDGDFTGARLPQFESEVHSAVLSGSHVVLDMSKTTFIGADGLGSLIHVMNIARSWKRELWLAGLHWFLLQIVRAAQLRPSFRMSTKVAEALRRIEPELIPVRQSEKDWAYCQIGGQMVPIHAREMPQVYRQIQQLLSRRLTAEPMPVLSVSAQEMDPRLQTLVPVDGAWDRGMSQMAPHWPDIQDPVSKTSNRGQWDRVPGPARREKIVRYR
jgi:anti-anti-sigma factor